MERFGSNVTTQAMTSHEYIRRALQACEGTPVTIERGAVQKLAEALEHIIHASSHYTLREEDGVVVDAREALRAYYGDSDMC